MNTIKRLISFKSHLWIMSGVGTDRTNLFCGTVSYGEQGYDIEVIMEILHLVYNE